MTNLSYTYRLTLLFISLLSVGCATQTRPAGELVSEVNIQRFSGTEKTLSVNSVSGGEVSKPSAWAVTTPKIDNDQFKELLVGSIKKSGLFKEVTNRSSADVMLNAEIIFQEMTTGGLTNTLMLLVKYQLVDSRSGNVILNENIYTQTELSAGEVFAGNIRIVRLLEQGLILNMNTLIKKIESEVR